MNFRQFSNTSTTATVSAPIAAQDIKPDVFVSEPIGASDYDAVGGIPVGKNIVVYDNPDISPFPWMTIYRNPIATRANGKSADAGCIVVNWNRSPWSAKVAMSALSHLTKYEYEIGAGYVEQVNGLIAVDLNKAEIEFGTPNLLRVGGAVVPFYVPSPKVEEEMKAKAASLKGAKGETWVILSKFGGVYRLEEYAKAYRAAMYSLLEKLSGGKDIMVKGLDSKIPAYVIKSPTAEQQKFMFNGWFYDAAPWTSEVLANMSLATPEERQAAFNDKLKGIRQQKAINSEVKVAEKVLAQNGGVSEEQASKIEAMVLPINPVWSATDLMWVGALRAAGLLSEDGKGIVLANLKSKITLKKYNAVSNVPHTIKAKIVIDPEGTDEEVAAFLLTFKDTQVNFGVAAFEIAQ
jgi:hypothetical protein